MSVEKQSNKAHILVVDDDKRICDLVSRYLQENGFLAISSNSADAAIEMISRFLFDAIVLDVMMPDKTGVELTQEIRANGNETPVILLTALGEVEDRISGLEAGADDYLSKPFEPKELILRIDSILRRTRTKTSDKVCYKIGCWYFDPDFDELVNDIKKGDEIRLTSVEAKLLRALAESAGAAVSRETLAQRCGLDAGERTIDVQVTRLRRKIEENTKTPKYLQTVRGKGYLLRAERT